MATESIEEIVRNNLKSALKIINYRGYGDLHLLKVSIEKDADGTYSMHGLDENRLLYILESLVMLKEEENEEKKFWLQEWKGG